MLLTLWLVVAFSAIGVGTWALSLVGGKINERTVEPLSQSRIRNELADDRSPDGTPTPTGTAGPSDGTATGTTRGLRTPGGNITATCRNGLALLRSWSPNPGYRSDDDSVPRGPAVEVRLEFKSDVAEGVEVRVRCVNGVPTPDVATQPDGRGATPTTTRPPSPGGGVATVPQATSGGHGADDPLGDDHGGSRSGG